MAEHELQHAPYEAVGEARVRHDTDDHRQGMAHYHEPLLHMHRAALHGRLRAGWPGGLP